MLFYYSLKPVVSKPRLYSASASPTVPCIGRVVVTGACLVVRPELLLASAAAAAAADIRSSNSNTRSDRNSFDDPGKLLVLALLVLAVTGNAPRHKALFFLLDEINADEKLLITSNETTTQPKLLIL